MCSDLNKPIYNFNSKLEIIECNVNTSHTMVHYSGLNSINQYRNFVDERSGIFTKITPPVNTNVLEQGVKEEIFLTGSNSLMYSIIRQNNLVDVHILLLDNDTLLVDLDDILHDCRQKLAAS